MSLHSGLPASFLKGKDIAIQSYSEGYLTSEQGKFADKMRTEEEQLDCSVSKESVICLRGS